MSTLYNAVTSNWDISKKIVAYVIDNAANMRSAVRQTGCTQIACTAHTLQLAVHDALEKNQQIQVILGKCRGIVGHFKRSNLANGKLVEEQKRLEIEVHKLIQDVN